MSRWSPAEIEQLVERMLARTQGFRISAATAPLVIEALSTHAAMLRKPEVNFRIEQWDDRGQHVVECLAIAGNLAVARAAYEAALSERPNAPLTLRSGAHVIRRSREMAE